ncbi:hypothetical protein OGZ01_32285 [Vibrio harveyi]|nr:hypothetical protein [Vibrio harveyi]
MSGLFSISLRDLTLRIDKLIAVIERFNGFIGKPSSKAFGVIDITSDEGDIILTVVGIGSDWLAMLNMLVRY